MARLASRPSVSLINKPKKKIFGSDDEGDASILTGTKKQVEEEEEKKEESEEEDSDDEAPEEEGFSQAKNTLSRKQREQQELIIKQRLEEREQRRERDEQLRKQKEESKIRQSAKEAAHIEKLKAQEKQKEEEIKAETALLDASLLAEIDEQALVLPRGKKTTFNAATKSSSLKKNNKESFKETTSKLASKTRESTIKVVKKGPVNVAVLKKNRKSMMPPKAQIVDEMRNKWYTESQKTVERRVRR
ncbi:uncharacterized protein SAPINGB_P000315 [Magnusiomyces paraingens]|uniref:Uncharacterized protein n=1 Tax=Magnusiomyces paraingens TaxID=2606893 RepID=A0A5E8AZM2_9ASCO|nr:uncharacterized protein SAPINGB_P000315 [Saprochaete ingens]VVT44134.1 unnamed protein product [Saprochaete ingens]